MLGLFIFAFIINQISGNRGLFPLDSASHFDNGYRILFGQHPVKDYWIISGFIIDYLQSFLFLLFGTNWQVYVAHASLFNGLLAVLVLFFFHKIGKIIKSSNTKIVHAWMYHACLLVSIIKIFYSKKFKLVWGIRCSNMQLKYYSWTLRCVILSCKFLSFLANSIIYNSHAGLKHHSSLGFSNAFSKVIYNGIDEKKFYFSNIKRNKLRKTLGIKRDSVVIICASRVDPMKNHLNLLSAFERQ